MSWIETTLEQSCEMYQPQTITTKDLVADGEFPVYGANGVIGRYNKYNHEAPQLLITCRGATCGAVNVSTSYAWINGNAMVVKPKDSEISLKFLEYFFRGAVDLSKAITGAAQPQITRQSLNPIKFSYPRLSTQQIIVNKLDLIFSEIDKAIAATEKSSKNAEALFQSQLTKIFESGGENWKAVKLNQIAEYFNGLTYSPKDVSDAGIIVLRSSNIQNDELAFEDIVRVNLKVKEKIVVRDGDILMCSRNGSKRLVGKTATIKNLNESMTFGTFMMIVRSDLNPFLEWFFKSNSFKKQISGGENTMINQVTRYMLDDITLRIPPEDELKSIIQMLSNIFQESRKLQATYANRCAELFAMKNSILQQAFNGELVKE